MAMGRWSLTANDVALGWHLLLILVIGLIMLTSHVQPAAIRSRRDSAASLSLALSDLHNDIYTGSNKGDWDWNYGNSIDKMSPEPAPAPAPAPAPDPAPAPAPVPDPAPAPEPAKPDPPAARDPDSPQAGPDFSNTEDDDGHGNNAGPDTPSVDPPGQQQQHEDQQQQTGPTTPQPPPVPDTPEPLPPSEVASNTADHAPDTGSSEEKTGPTNVADPSSPGGPNAAPVGSPDGLGGLYGSPDPFDPFGAKTGPLVKNYVDPFDPFFAAGPPPPPPPHAPPPPGPHFGGSINMGGNMATTPPPPPPPIGIIGRHIPPPHPPPGPSPFDPFMSKSPKPPPLPPTKNSQQPHPNEAREKAAPVEKISTAEAKSLAIDKKNDMMDMRQEKMSEIRALINNKNNSKGPVVRPPPPPEEERQPLPGLSEAELKSLTVDKAHDALDRQADMAAMAKELAPRFRG